MIHPIPAQLRELLRYDPDSGKLFWKERSLDQCSNERTMRAFNAQFAGKEAFTADNGDGYRCSHIFGRTYRAHRVIWAMVHDYWPENQIDHINGRRDDNRLSNLRHLSHAENQQNRKPKTGCLSSLKGVTYIRRSKRWQARICANGVRRHLGVFDTQEQAHAAYCKASEIYHGDCGRSR